MTLIWMSWNSEYGSGSSHGDAIGDLANRYRALPRHIAKKHLMAAMRRTIRGGVPILRRYTPPVGTRRGRRKKGERAKSTGELRRSVTVRTGQKGNNGDFNSFVYGVLGYRYGWPSRKAIWLETGTKAGVRGYRMMENATREFGRPAADKLAAEMAAGLEKAAKELASKKNPGMSRRGLAAGVAPRN